MIRANRDFFGHAGALPQGDDRLFFRDFALAVADAEYNQGLLSAADCVQLRYKFDMLSDDEFAEVMAAVARYCEGASKPSDVGLFGEDELSAREQLIARGVNEERIGSATAKEPSKR